MEGAGEKDSAEAGCDRKPCVCGVASPVATPSSEEASRSRVQAALLVGRTVHWPKPDLPRWCKLVGATAPEGEDSRMYKCTTPQLLLGLHDVLRRHAVPHLARVLLCRSCAFIKRRHFLKSEQRGRGARVARSAKVCTHPPCHLKYHSQVCVVRAAPLPPPSKIQPWGVATLGLWLGSCSVWPRTTLTSTWGEAGFKSPYGSPVGFAADAAWEQEITQCYDPL
jgi:hypothetical protein